METTTTIPRFTVRIPDDLDEVLDTFVAVTGRSKNSVFVDALRAHLSEETTKTDFVAALKNRNRRFQQAARRGLASE